MNRIPFSRYMKRTPVFGWGCMGGAAGLARTADYLEGHPNEAAVLLSIELCSLTLQRDDLSVANLVSSGLFGDGAGALLLVGREHPLAARPGQAQVLGSRSVFFPQTEYIMGYDIRDTGFKMILGPNVAETLGAVLRPEIEAFLAGFGVSIADISHWVAHPGGPRIMDAIEQALSLPKDALELSRNSLARVGNLSSASVIVILQDTLEQRKPAPGAYGLLMAFGPGFSAELSLLRW
jgi:alkylresorcinol/alkylpyrone synthase